MRQNVVWLLLSAFFWSCTNANVELNLGQSSLSGGGPRPTMSIADQTVPEFGVASVLVSLSGTSTQNITFSYYTQSVTATDGVEYIGVSGTATIAAGKTQAYVAIPIRENYAFTGDKTLRFNISSATNANLGTSTAQIQIIDDESAPLSGIQKVKTGAQHACLLTTAGGLKCWGNNSNGQLGDGTTINRAFPVDVTGLTSGVVDVSLGNLFTCALTSAGGIKCWGYNSDGQLGDGTTTTRTVPTDATGLTAGMASISAGTSHACGVSAGGAARCWGYNFNYQIGDGTTTNRPSFVGVSGLSSGVASISAGYGTTCAVLTSGGLKCWGRNDQHQVGDGTTTARPTPVDPTGMTSGVASVAVGSYHTCAVMTSGNLKCWGGNSSGEIGDGTFSPRSSAVTVTSLGVNVSQVSAANGITCARTNSGDAYCWGKNDVGQLGSNSVEQLIIPTMVTGLSGNVSSVSASEFFGCATLSDTTARCWGDSFYGKLANKYSSAQTKPAEIQSLGSGISSMGLGAMHSCALNTSGDLKCWGNNASGRLGDNSILTKTNPVFVSSSITSVAAGMNHTCAIASTSVKCWGEGINGAIGNGSTTNVGYPVSIGSWTNLSSLSLGYYHSCVVDNGAAKCWGRGTDGQIGDGAAVNRLSPTSVTGLSSGVLQISGGGAFTCALIDTGDIKCWGMGTNGQLGSGVATSNASPASVIGVGAGSGVVSITAGYRHACALYATGSVKCWGDNTYGQIGDGTNTQRNSPVSVGISDVASIVAGGDTTCAKLNSGAVKCWGQNDYGQLADMTLIFKTVPTDVLGLTSGVDKLYAGKAHFCAVLNTGTVKCWGDNTAFQLNPLLSSLVPYPVLAF